MQMKKTIRITSAILLLMCLLGTLLPNEIRAEEQISDVVEVDEIEAVEADSVDTEVVEETTEGETDVVEVTDEENTPQYAPSDNVDPETNFYFTVKSDNTAVITGYLLVGSASDNKGDLNIPGTVKTEDGKSHTVTEIGAEAFSADTRFTGSLTIPDSVKIINDSAFDGCGGLKGSLVIPDSVTYIGSYAFRECRGMNGELEIGENVETISDYAFFGCSNLQGGIEFPAKLKKIGASAFQGCTGFEGKLTFGNGSIDEIGNSAFSGLNITGGITFPGKVGSIGQQAFYECKKLDGNLVFMNDVNYIDKYAFAYCSYLRGSITLNNTSVKDNSFKSCKKLGPVLTLGKNTDWDDSVGMYSHSFLYCCGIQKVVNKSDNKFTLSGLKSDSYKDPWGSWVDQNGKYVYDIKNGTATREDFVDQYSITVTGVAEAYNPETKYLIYSAKKGETVGIQWAYFEDDKEFVRWETKNKGVKFANPNSWQTTFTMPAEDVIITYVEKEKAPAQYYTITMMEGSEAYDEDEYQIDEAQEGDLVNVYWLYEGDDKEFVRWESNNKKVKFKDPYDYDTTFVMPAENVTVTYVEKEKGEPEPEPETKICPNVVTKQKVDLSIADYFGQSFEKKDKWSVSDTKIGSVSKGIFTAKKPGTVTVTWMDKDKNVKGIAKFDVEAPEIDYPINPKNNKKLTTFTYYRIGEEVDVTKLISTPTGLTPVRYECTDKKGKNFSFNPDTNILTVLKTGNCKINVYYNYGDNEKYAGKHTINIKSSLPKLKEKLKLTATKSTTVTISNVQTDLQVSWGAYVWNEETEDWDETDKLIIDEVSGSNGRKCKITANGNKGDEIYLTAFVGEYEDEYDCIVTIK